MLFALCRLNCFCYFPVWCLEQDSIVMVISSSVLATLYFQNFGDSIVVRKILLIEPHQANLCLRAFRHDKL